MRSPSKQESALRIIFGLVALAVLVAASWCGFHGVGESPPLASVPIPLKAENLPDTPAKWHGRIDYRALDRRLAALAQRPEMAGPAVAVVEDGKLRFVRTYGVADRKTGAPVTPHPLFRWASVRSDERRVGKAWVRPGTLRCSPYHSKKKQQQQQ